MTPRVLVVAGSDSGGGAGIQADIKTITMLGGHAMTAVTAITAQNTLGVEAVFVVPPELVVRQMACVIEDIGSDAVKIGMLGSASVASAVADELRTGLYAPIVFDPVMIATSGATLADHATIAVMQRLARMSALVTPNLPELAALCGRVTLDPSEIGDAAIAYAAEIGAALLVKGGHGEGAMVVDRLVDGSGEIAQWSNPRIATTSTHGTGCTLSSAIAEGLGRGMDLSAAVGRGIGFVRASIEHAPGLGSGHGPMGQQFARGF